jgi:peptide/nickel transport system permease protein
MFAYVLRRLGIAAILLLLISFLSFALMTLMPGDPVQELMLSNPDMTAQDVSRLRALHGLDDPLPVRYGRWLGDTLRGDFGYSRTYKVPVTDLLGDRLVNTAVLSLSALALSLAFALPVGIIAALRAGGKFDYSSNLLAFAGQSVPPFWLGIMFIMIFAERLGWFPAGGTSTIGAEHASAWAALGDRLKYITLPVLVFTVSQMAVYVRYTRGAMIEALRADHVRTARAKGNPEWRVVGVHALRNALIPLVTIVALALGGAFGGAIITEQVFAYQGVGKLVYEAILAGDHAVAMVAFNLTIGLVLVMNLAADVCYAALDPRIAYR